MVCNGILDEFRDKLRLYAMRYKSLSQAGVDQDSLDTYVMAKVSIHDDDKVAGAKVQSVNVSGTMNHDVLTTTVIIVCGSLH